MSSRVTRPRTRPVSMRTRRQRIAAGAVLATTSLLGTYLAAIRPQPTYAAPNTGAEQGQALFGSANVSANALNLPTCAQADVTVTNEADLRSAITSSADDSVICIDGTITLNADLPTLDDTSVSFVGDDSTTDVIDGATYYRGIVANFNGGTDDTLIINSIGMNRLYAGGTDDGGAVHLYSDGSDYFFASDSEFSSNYSGDLGGAIYLVDVKEATLSGITATSNYAADKGAFLYVEYDVAPAYPVVTVEDLNATSNYSANRGGAIAFEFGSLTIRSSVFSNNEVRSGTYDGGGIFFKGNGAGHSLSVLDSVFTDNSATQDGGAIYVDDAELSITNSTFQRNSAIEGGAVYIYSGAVTVTNSTFTANEATANGGALKNDDVNSLTTIRNSTFIDNKAGSSGQSDGGAVDTKELELSNSYFLNNYATQYGGAIWVGDFADITSSTFVGNDAVLTGGAVYVDGDSGTTTVIRGSSFIENGDDTAPQKGGGLYFWDNGALDIANSTFIGNTAEQGGGIYIAVNNDYDDTISYTTIVNNTATGGSTPPSSGGGIFADDTITLLNSIVSGNTATLFFDARLNPNYGNIQNNVFTSSGTTNNYGSNPEFGSPLLASIADNGGPLVGDDSAYYLPTAIPAWNSPAVGTANPALTPSITTTQIGTARAGNVAGSMNASAAPTPPTPTPTYPPSAPLNVTGTGGDQSATITWTEPASSGSFPITDYQVVLAPGGATCLVQAPALSCTIDGLTNGTEYTATARALNGSGWGPYSTASEPFTPENPTPPVTKTIVITGSRTEVRGKPGVQADGTTTGLVGATVQARVHLAGEVDYYDGSKRTVNDDGTFVWSRRTGKKTYVFFTAEGGTIRSNRVVIQAN